MTRKPILCLDFARVRTAPHIQQRLRRHGGDARTMAIQIDNLVDYMRREVRRR